MCSVFCVWSQRKAPLSSYRPGPRGCPRNDATIFVVLSLGLGLFLFPPPPLLLLVLPALLLGRAVVDPYGSHHKY